MQKPGLKEAFEMNARAEMLIFSYVWPFFAVFIGGVIIIYLSFPEIQEKTFLLAAAILAVLGIIINIVYYKKQRE